MPSLKQISEEYFESVGSGFDKALKVYHKAVTDYCRIITIQLTWPESLKAEWLLLAFPFGSDLRRNLDKKLGDCDGEGVVTVRELVDPWDIVEDPETSLILTPGSLLFVQMSTLWLLDKMDESTEVIEDTVTIIYITIQGKGLQFSSPPHSTSWVSLSLYLIKTLLITRRYYDSQSTSIILCSFC